MKALTIYIIGVTASGKSTFARKHPNFLGYEIVDFAEHLPGRTRVDRILRFLKRVTLIINRRRSEDGTVDEEDKYFHHVSAFLERRSEVVVVMGRRTPDTPSDWDDFNHVRVGAVLIREEDHLRNCRERNRKLRYSLPFFRHRKIDVSNVLGARKNTLEYAMRNKIPIFESFPEAIRSMSRWKVR